MPLTSDLTGLGIPAAQAVLVGDALSTGLAAAGTTQAAGTLVPNGVSVFSTITAASAEACRLPAAQPLNDHLVIVNSHATAALKIFPQVGGTINALAQDAVFSIAAGKTVILFPVSATQWYGVLTA